MSKIVVDIKKYNAELTKRNVNFPMLIGGMLKSQRNTDIKDKMRKTI